MFTSSGDVPSGTDFSELGEDDNFTWHQFTSRAGERET